MTKEDIIAMAREAGFADGVAEIVGLAGFERLVELAQAAERNKLASWMIAQGYATGHGDTMEQLLEEFKREASFDRAELWIKRINDAVLAEREACAKVAEKRSEPGTAAFIRARGQT